MVDLQHKYECTELFSSGQQTEETSFYVESDNQEANSGHIIILDTIGHSVILC